MIVRDVRIRGCDLFYFVHQVYNIVIIIQSHVPIIYHYVYVRGRDSAQLVYSIGKRERVGDRYICIYRSLYCFPSAESTSENRHLPHIL